VIRASEKVTLFVRRSRSLGRKQPQRFIKSCPSNVESNVEVDVRLLVPAIWGDFRCRRSNSSLVSGDFIFLSISWYVGSWLDLGYMID